MKPPNAIALLSVALLVAGLVVTPAFGASAVIPLALGVAFTATGAVVAVRQPRNAIGWLFLGVGVAAALAQLSHAIPDRELAGGGSLSRAGAVLGAYGSASWVPMMIPGLTFLLLLFPDGRLIGPRWRIVAWCAGVGIVAAFAGTLLVPGRLEDYPSAVNPLGTSLASAFNAVAVVSLLVALIGSPASLVRRFRRADGTTREQIKWLTFAGAVAAATFILGLLLFDLLPENVIYGAMMLSVLALPVAAALAILRYRLYDIDVVINRALVYAGLTGTLVAAYFGSVLLMQLVLSPLTEQSDLAIAVSTLGVAALFQPARRRIQGIVDRRFFRKRYDAANTLSAFGVRLRDEVDLDALSLELRAVVADTMQPAHVSLWLRDR